MMVLPFAATVHLLLYPNKEEEKDRISFSCRFKSGQEHQISQLLEALKTESPKKDTAKMDNKNRVIVDSKE